MTRTPIIHQNNNPNTRLPTNRLEQLITENLRLQKPRSRVLRVPNRAHNRIRINKRAHLLPVNSQSSHNLRVIQHRLQPLSQLHRHPRQHSRVTSQLPILRRRQHRRQASPQIPRLRPASRTSTLTQRLIGFSNPTHRLPTPRILSDRTRIHPKRRLPTSNQLPQCLHHPRGTQNIHHIRQPISKRAKVPRHIQIGFQPLRR